MHKVGLSASVWKKRDGHIENDKKRYIFGEKSTINNQNKHFSAI